MNHVVADYAELCIFHEIISLRFKFSALFVSGELIMGKTVE